MSNFDSDRNHHDGWTGEPNQVHESADPFVGRKSHPKETATAQRAGLPIANSERWQLLRSGLINLFHYADEQFWYEDGRLLLRGNNGTGKSRVLALQLPFLLDAELSPTRMEPDRSPSKRPEWNLLLGGKHRDRLGYTWLELGRIDDSGTEHYFTIGCGLHAVKDRGRVDAWFFTTDQRMDQHLNLVHDRVPLSKTRLAEELDHTGTIHRTRGDYVNAIDQRLFRLGPRYRALVDLLIQLRVPQLSRDFDEKRISTQLSDALPPLAQEIMGQVADAMRDLDEQRQRLEEARRSSEAITRFQGNYSGYLQIALKRRVGDFFQKHNQFDRTQRKINEDSRLLETAAQRLQTIRHGITGARREDAELEARLRVLRQRPEMRDAQRLDDFRVQCQKLTNRFERAEHQLVQDERSYKAEEQRLARLADQLAFERKQVLTSIKELAGHEAPPSLKTATNDARQTLVDGQVDIKPLANIEKVVAEVFRSEKVLKEHAAKIEMAEIQLRRGIERQSECEHRLENSHHATQSTLEALIGSRRQLCLAWLSWREEAGAILKTLPKPDDFAALLETQRGLEDPDGPDTNTNAESLSENPSELVRAVVATAMGEALASAQGERIEIEAELKRINEDLESKAVKLAELEAGTHVPPPTPHTRPEDGRVGRAGAPFYELVDFVSEIPDHEQPLWEAAMEAAGLLDAWVTPKGSIDPTNKSMLGDTFTTLETSLPDPESNMTLVLCPAAAMPQGMNEEGVVALLKRLGCGRMAGQVWFDHDGSWQIGPQTGVWRKETTQHIGAATREQRRQEFMAIVRDEIAQLEATQTQFQAAVDAIRSTLDRLRSVQSSLPNDAKYTRGLADHQAAQKRAVEEAAALKSQIEIVGKLRDVLSNAIAARDRVAEDLGLADWAQRLDELRDTARQIENDIKTLRAELNALAQRIESVAQARRLTDEADERARSQRQSATAIEHELRAAQSALATLEQSAGKDVQKILDEIDQSEQQQQAIAGQLESLREQQLSATEEKSRLEGKLDESRTTLEAFDSERRSRIANLEWFVDTGLMEQASLEDDSPNQTDFPDSPWSPTRAFGIAKELRSKLDRVRDSDRVWEDAQNDLSVQFKTLEQTLLPTGMTPQMQTLDSLMTFRVPYQGIQQSPKNLSRLMAEEVRSRDALITQRERELFEERLVGDIAYALHQNIRSSHLLCQTMNEQVESRPMSTGMRLRFKWRERHDESEELKSACKALLKQPAAMSPEEQASLGRFLQTRIAEARERDDEGTWRQHLVEALDYRNWFAFEIQRETNGKWERLTKRTHGTGSGGERAVSLIMPMLAALAAYYESADPLAPRIILMDEAYVGIDNEMRAKFMDLLVQFDLDFIMTSEREWGCYPTMPSLAIYHLATRPGVDAILPTRWIWNGRRRSQSEVQRKARQQELFEDDQ